MFIFHEIKKLSALAFVPIYNFISAFDNMDERINGRYYNNIIFC